MDEHARDLDLSTGGEEPPAKRRKKTPTFLSSREVGLMRSMQGDKISTFVGSSSGVYFIRSVYSALHAHPNTSVPDSTSGSNIVPGEDDHLLDASPNVPRQLWKSHEISTCGNTLLTFQNLLDWSRSYFAHWHPAYPFLHAPAILTFFETLAQRRDARDATPSEHDIVILKSIMSISLADRRQCFTECEEPYPAEIVFQSYDEAIQSAQHAISQPVSMQSLQAALGVQLFLVSMLRFNAASRLGGLIIRMALQMGLHRCPQRYPSFSLAQKELRHRVFFSLYCIDRFICQSTGLPLSLRDDDTDVCYLSHERHAGGRSSPDTRLRLLEFLSRHCRIRGEIMELKHKCIQHTRRETDQSTMITSQLSKLANDIGEFIDLDEVEPPTFSSYHKSLLEIMYHEAVISLNRPIIASKKSGPSYDAALQQCIASARFIITALHNAIKPASAESQRSFSLLWPSFTWAVWMSSFILFHAAATKHVSAAMVSRFADRSLGVLEHLARRGSVWPEACGAAIRDLQAQLTLSVSEKPTASHAAVRELTSPSPYNMTYPYSTQMPNATQVPSDASPHVVARSWNQTTGHPHGEYRQEDLTACNSGDASVARTDTLTADCMASSVGSRSIDQVTGGENADLNMQLNSLNSSVPPVDDSCQVDPGRGLEALNDDEQDDFSGFDIPFWLGQDQYSGMVSEWS